MSDDLISRQAVLDTLERVFKKYNICFGGNDGGFANAVPKAIEDLPVAYDVDKVVEHIEELKHPYRSFSDEHGALDQYDYYIEKAKELVKAGGKDD